MMDMLIFHSGTPEWIEGLPAGNGRIGLMAYGLPGKECFQFNADTLFRHNVTKRILSADLIPVMRKLVLAGRGNEADQLFSERTAETPEDCNAYQPFMELKTEISNPLAPYRRSIDLKNGIVNAGNWELFASSPDQVIVMRSSLKKGDSLTLTLCRTEDPDCRYTAFWKDGKGFFDGEFTEGVRFSAQIEVITDGTLSAEENTLAVSGTDSLELRIAMKTSQESAAEPEEILKNTAGFTFTELKERHSTDFRTLFSRMTLSLGKESRTTEELYAESRNAGHGTPALFAQMFAFARYLMISAARPGTLPPNLQGLWNNLLKPEWESGYTMDMNVQMAYWFAEAANLGECHSALFDFLESRLDIMHQQAKDIFGAEDAAYIPQYTDMFLTPTCWHRYSLGTFQVIWSGAAAWLASHFYQHWKYSGDNGFGRNRAFPFLKQCMNLYFTLLSRDENGKWILAPSCNPEQWAKGSGRVVHTATMDLSLIHELAQNLLELDDVLEINDPLAGRWKEIDENLTDYPVDASGMLLEWCDEREVNDPSHRHLSHIYGLYPSHLFDTDDVMRNAALKAVEKRTEKGLFNSSTWSFSWYSCLYARLGCGGKVAEFMDHIVKAGLLPNLLTTHNDWRPGTPYSHMTPERVFQSDALFGYAAAVCEALAHEQGGEVILLSAVPEDWKKEGCVSGLCISGQTELSFAWKEGVITELKAVSPIRRILKVRFPDGSIKEIAAQGEKE